MKRFLYILQGLVMVAAAFIAICPPTIVMRGLANVRTVLIPFWLNKAGQEMIVQRDIAVAVSIGFALFVIELGLWWFMFMLRQPNQEPSSKADRD